MSFMIGSVDVEEVQPPLPPAPPPDPSIKLKPSNWAGRVGQRDWADNDGSDGGPVVVQSAWEILYMPQMYGSVIQGQVTRGPEFKRAVQQFIDDAKDPVTGNPDHKVHIYMILNEVGTSLSGVKHDLMIANVGAPGENVNPASPINFSCWYARNPAGDLFSTFPGSFAVNLTGFATADGSGRHFAQAYIADVWPADYITPFTNLDGYFIDVFDFNPKISNTDYNGDGTADNADDDWNNNGLSETICNSYRAGQAESIPPMRVAVPGVSILVNYTDHERENDFEDQSLWLNENDANDNYSEYKDLYDGGWIEELVNAPGDNGFAGMDGAGNYRTFGNPRKAWNQIRHHAIYSLDDKLVLPSFIFHSNGAVVDPVVGVSEVTSDTFCMLRFAEAMGNLDVGSTILGNSSNSGSRYNRTPVIDEMGLNATNNLTTLLSPGWMGLPTETALSVREVAKGGADPWLTIGGVEIYKAECQNGVSLCIWGKPSGLSNGDPITATVIIPVDDALTDWTGNAIPGNVVRFFNGVQDPVFNNGDTVNETNHPSGLSVRVMNGIFFVNL